MEEKQTITIDYAEYKALYAIFSRALHWRDELPDRVARKVDECANYYESVGLTREGLPKK